MKLLITKERPSTAEYQRQIHYQQDRKSTPNEVINSLPNKTRTSGTRVKRGEENE